MRRAQTRSGVYEIVNTVNGNRYIGSAVNFSKRFELHRRHLRQMKHHSVTLQRAWNKYGGASFAFNIVLLCEKKDALMYEQLAIDACAPSYNVCRVAGSRLGTKHTAAARKKMSDGQRCRGARTPEEKEKISAALKGKKKSAQHARNIGTGHLGQKRSDLSRAKMAAAHIGVKRGPHSEQHKNSISAALIGKKHSPQRCANMVASRWPQRAT